MKLTHVINKSGEKEPIDLMQITSKIHKICNDPIYGYALDIDEVMLGVKTIESIYNNIPTSELDAQTCRIAFAKYVEHPDYDKLAARIAIDSLIKDIKRRSCGDDIETYCKELKGVLSENTIKCWLSNKEFIKKTMNFTNNFRFSYRGFFLMKEGSYLLRSHDKLIAETPDFATMRIAINLIMFDRVEMTKEDQMKIRELYEELSNMNFTFATPVYLNAGTISPQYASCFLMKMDDSLNSIMNIVKSSALCQKYSGGIGISLGSLRAKGSLIKGTNGIASGLEPLCKMLDKLGYYVDQGGGKRPGSISPYIPDYHPDLLNVIQLRDVSNLTNAAENHRLFYAVWTSNLFLHQVQCDGLWYFICPSVCDLSNFYGKEFEVKSWCIVNEGRYNFSMPAREVMKKILVVQASAGLPYIVNKDNVNLTKNQPPVIYSSNLCTEITLPTNEQEIGVCNLASISVKKFVNRDVNGEYLNLLTNLRYSLNLDKLKKNASILVRVLNNIIDNGFYAVDECKNSNNLRRPIGIGIMGLADALCKLGIVFGSKEACAFRARFEEALTYFCYEESIELAKIYGSIKDHDQYQSGKGKLHPVLFAENWPVEKMYFDWHELGERTKKYGLRNSVLRADMPTNSTGVIMGNSPCFEPYESNIYKFVAYSMELITINKRLHKDLTRFGLINSKFLNRFISLSGRIQDINFKYFTENQEFLEKEALFKQIYRVAAFEISPKEIMDMAIAAQPFIDQSQSMNLWTNKISINTFQYYKYGADRGLKTLCYYIKTNTAGSENICSGCVV